jgi:hypothetical protein
MQQSYTPSDLYPYKTKFALLGTTGSGKTTIADLILITAMTMSANLPNFFCRVLEGTSDVIEGQSNLRIGKFPPKTVPFASSVYEAGILMTWKEMFGEKRIHMPIVDIAGEDIAMMIRKKVPNNPDFVNFQASMQLVNDVRDADGFIMAVPASRAFLFHHDIQLEKEAGDLPIDPDVNLHRILSSIITYKEQVKGKPIKAIAVIITKWDLVLPFAAKYDMDILESSGRGIKNFMENCFPATSSELKASKIKEIEFFPSFVDLDYEPDGKTVRHWPDTNSPMIKLKAPDEWHIYKRVPSYAASSYVKLLNFLGHYAAG